MQSLQGCSQTRAYPTRISNGAREPNDVNLFVGKT